MLSFKRRYARQQRQRSAPEFVKPYVSGPGAESDPSTPMLCAARGPRRQSPPPFVGGEETLYAASMA
jgi:hypothetical protein